MTKQKDNKLNKLYIIGLIFVLAISFLNIHLEVKENGHNIIQHEFVYSGDRIQIESASSINSIYCNDDKITWYITDEDVYGYGWQRHVVFEGSSGDCTIDYSVDGLRLAWL